MLTHVAILFDKLVKATRPDSTFECVWSDRYKKYIYSLPAPNRHHNIISQLYCETGKSVDVNCSTEQGFLDDALPGYFLNRKQALVRAFGYGQVKDKNKVRHAELTSEDVW